MALLFPLEARADIIGQSLGESFELWKRKAFDCREGRCFLHLSSVQKCKWTTIVLQSADTRQKQALSVKLHCLPINHSE